MNNEKCQAKFFDAYARNFKPVNDANLFANFGYEEVADGFKWLGVSDSVLDYGVGTGENISRYLQTTPPDSKINFVGVDISLESIIYCSKNYDGSFYHITDNNIPELRDSSVDSAYLIMVLHHSVDHLKIFKEISRVLKSGSRFFIYDMTATNPLHAMGRYLFTYIPNRSKSSFKDDLYVDGMIPEKLPVYVDCVINDLQQAGFKIISIKRSHLFFFIFDWIDKLIQCNFFSNRTKFVHAIYKLDRFLSGVPFLRNSAAVFSAYVEKI